MYIEMDKIQEDDDWVCYKFTTKVWEKSQKNQEQYELAAKVGYGKFNISNESFVLDKIKSDPYFLHDDSPIVFKVKVKLIKQKRLKQGFPDKLEIAIG